jgi:hypothetical protein
LHKALTLALGFLKELTELFNMVPASVGQIVIYYAKCDEKSPHRLGEL